MRILWVKAGKLLPVDTGGKIRSFNILRQLAVTNDVRLLSYYGGSRDEGYEREINEMFPGAVTINTAAPDSGLLGRAIDYLRRLPSRAPYAVTKFSSKQVRRILQSWLNEDRFDVAVCDFLSVSLDFPAAHRTPAVLFQHNVESILWERQAEHEPNSIKRMVFKIEAAKMRRYERETVARFPRVIAVSEHDRKQMSAMTEASRISVVPTGVDLKQYQAAASASAEEPLVIFVGSMDWEANIDGVDYFCREIWPSVKERTPEARLRIVGRNPHSRVKRLAGESIEVTGTVPSVVDHLKEAAVFVVPLRVGGGTRLKIYEAMAMGKAVVSTSIGAEGLDVTDGRDILLADNAANFADSVVALLKDRSRRRSVEQAAQDTAARYDWSIIAGRFEAALAEAASARAVETRSVAQTARAV
jgi:glycosyltransferase involved in cell wall biosynthesis